MKKRILIEASGSLITNWMLRAIRQNQDISIASDITEQCVGRFLADEFIVVPRKTDKNLWEKLEGILAGKKIDVVIPSLDETLRLWAEKKEYVKKYYGTKVAISDPETIDIFLDKYRTYLFFTEHDIPTPQTSLGSEFPLVKPRWGRGGKGIVYSETPYHGEMKGMISQEPLEGEEYTVDCLIDSNGIPVYIVPRKRLSVVEGKSINGVTVDHRKIIDYVEKICRCTRFTGPINVQCFETSDGIKFTELNPRIAGGMALGMAATENWIPLIVDHILEEIPVKNRKETRFNLMMYRYYEEIFV